jgi:transcriptional regulator with XRE-family HTH domain
VISAAIIAGMGNELRDFLTSRRAALSPSDVGLPGPTTARRVKGLRREEVAILAGVSVHYYVKLEQGRAGNVSGQVVDAVVRALRLDEVESRYLRSLLQPGSSRAARARPARQSMIRALSVPAVIHGPHLEVLGINHAGKTPARRLRAMPVADRNTARWRFLNPRARVVYRDWADIAADVVAVLRASPAGEPLSRLVGDLRRRPAAQLGDAPPAGQPGAEHHRLQRGHGFAFGGEAAPVVQLERGRGRLAAAVRRDGSG